MSNNKELIGIGDIAKKAGLPIPTIRHYTKLGLLKVVSFSDGGRYLYNKQETLEAIKYINELSSRGFRLNEIKEKFSSKKNSKNVVIIESNESYAKFLKSVIGHICPFWRIEIASSSFDAGHMIVDVLPDLILIDINLPQHERKRIYNFVKESIALRHTKTIALITEESKGNKEVNLEKGIETCSIKPIDVEKLMNVVRKTLHL